ncbi:hypothetical protein, partial [Sphingobacterium cavernae]|uniref:hypothetical protein n=1 Tax=Sphingobacterium cavernae TaxID=2592657 RepID=UPI001CB7D70E
TNEQLDIACARALYFHAFSYQHIKGICEKGLFELPKENGATLRFSDEFQHELSFYDNLTN